MYGDDISWPQGQTGGGQPFNIIAAASCDSRPDPFIQSTYHGQVDASKARGEETGQYFFNGGDPAAFATFAANNLYRFDAGDPAFLDVETQSNRAPAYTAPEALTFGHTFADKTGVMPGVYLNLSQIARDNWAPNVAAGQLLWLADYVTAIPQVAFWPSNRIVLWQYSSTPYDKDWARFPLAQIRAMQNVNKPVPPILEEDDMPPTILTDKVTGQMLYAFGNVFRLTNPTQVVALLHDGLGVQVIPTDVHARLSSIAH